MVQYEKRKKEVIDQLESAAYSDHKYSETAREILCIIQEQDRQIKLLKEQLN